MSCLEEQAAPVQQAADRAMMRAYSATYTFGSLKKTCSPAQFWESQPGRRWARWCFVHHHTSTHLTM